MPGFIIRLVITALGLWLADELLAGIYIDGGGTLVVAALLLGIVNAVVRPVIVLLTLPFTLFSLGLFLLVINGIMIEIVASLLHGFAVASLWSAIMASIIVSLTSWFASWYIGPHGRLEVIVIERRPRF